MIHGMGQEKHLTIRLQNSALHSWKYAINYQAVVFTVKVKQLLDEVEQDSRIIQTEVDVNWRNRRLSVALTEVSIIVDILRNPNSIIVLLFTLRKQIKEIDSNLINLTNFSGQEQVKIYFKVTINNIKYVINMFKATILAKIIVDAST